MSASDPNGYLVELGEFNLIIARASLGQRPRTVDAVREVWIGDNAAVDAALGELRPAGSTEKAIALLRVKGRGTYLATQAQGQSVANPGAVDAFIQSQLGAENTPANWSWANAADGLPPQGGARWVLDAAPTVHTDEAVTKVRSWSFDLLRCQSAPLTLIGGLATAARTAQASAPVLLCEISDTRSFLFSISAKGVVAAATVPVGFDSLAEATQTALGLKFRGSAARLMFNESYDFSEAAAKIVEPLANAIKGALPNLASPSQIVCGGILARQGWISQTLATAVGLKPFTVDAAAWANSNGLTLGSSVNPAEIAPSWLGLLSAAAAYNPANPSAATAWNSILSGTPVAATPAPAVVAAPPPPAIVQEPPKPAVPAKPVEIPAIIQEPPKPAASTPVAKPPAAPPKPSVVITPPAKPVEPPKPAAPAAPAKPATPPPPAPKPAEVKPPQPAPAKPTPAPAPAPAKTPAKAEPPKPAPAPTPKPAPAPAPVSAVKPATAAPFPPRRSNTPMIIGIAAVLLLGVGGFFFYNNTKQKEEIARIEAREREARIQAEADRARAAEEQARKESEARRQAEEKARLDAIAAEAARREAEQNAARSTTERLLSARGHLTVNTNPAGATVVVGELAPRTSPVSMRDLRLGSYSVTITLPGYDTERREIEIRESETTDLGTVVLRRQIGSIDLSSEPSGLSFEVRPAGALFVNPNDVRTGQTPANVSDLPVGSYQVTINRPNWMPYVATVSVERNGTAKVQGVFRGASITITSTPPGATVLRDNQVSIGTTPLTINDVSPGQVNFTVTQSGFEPASLSARVEGGKNITLNAVLLDSDRIVRLSELDERPVPVSQTEPELTSLMQAEGGSAVISFVVSTEGTPTDLRVEQASNPAFGRACLMAVTKWRFKPGTVGGKPVRTRVTIPFKIGPQN